MPDSRHSLKAPDVCGLRWVWWFTCQRHNDLKHATLVRLWHYLGPHRTAQRLPRRYPVGIVHSLGSVGMWSPPCQARPPARSAQTPFAQIRLTFSSCANSVKAHLCTMSRPCQELICETASKCAARCKTPHSICGKILGGGTTVFVW